MRFIQVCLQTFVSNRSCYLCSWFCSKPNTEDPEQENANQDSSKVAASEKVENQDEQNQKGKKRKKKEKPPVTEEPELTVGEEPQPSTSTANIEAELNAAEEQNEAADPFSNKELEEIGKIYIFRRSFIIKK